VVLGGVDVTTLLSLRKHCWDVCVRYWWEHCLRHCRSYMGCTVGAYPDVVGKRSLPFNGSSLACGHLLIAPSIKSKW